MLFCLSICDETHRVILDQDWYGPTLAMIEGKDWQEAREEAERHPALNAFSYRAGWGGGSGKFREIVRSQQQSSRSIVLKRPGISV